MKHLQRIIKSDEDLREFLKPSALSVLYACGAHYQAVIDEQIGAPVTPRVQYRPKTPRPGDPEFFVGDAYDNFSRVEVRPLALKYLADCLTKEVQRLSVKVDTVVTVPRGGIRIGQIIAENLKITPDRVVNASPDGTNLTKQWVRKVRDVLLVDDIYHRFSAARNILTHLQSLGISQITVACVINRALNPTVNGCLTATLWHESTWQCRPEDARSTPSVEDPISQWDELLEEMYSAHERLSQQQASGQLVQQF